MAADFGGKPFSFVHFLTVLLAKRAMPSWRLLWHHRYLPSGPWWDRARDLLELRECEQVESIFGNPVKHPAHKADVIRLRRLHELGGVYIDVDVWLLRDISHFAECNCVIAQQSRNGLCNAIIMAQRGSHFIAKWLDEYQDFDGENWDEHSVARPMKLALSYPELIHIQPESAFLWPSFTNPDLVFFETRSEFLKRRLKQLSETHHGVLQKLRMLPRLKYGPYGYLNYERSLDESRQQLRNAFTIHLWESQWWTRFLKHMDPYWVRDSKSVLAARLRELLGEEVLHDLSQYNSTAI